MGHFGRYFGWRQAWLLSVVLCMGLVVQAVLTLFPSRAQLAQSYLAQAVEMEKRFDLSLRNQSSQQLVARYAGVAPEEAVVRVRDRLRRAYGESLTRAGLHALNDRNREASRRVGADALLLDERPELTPEAAAMLDSEFEQLAQRYESRIASVPAQRRKAMAFGILVTGVPLALLYLLGELLARSGATARADGEAEGLPSEGALDAVRISAEPLRPPERDRGSPTPGAMPA